MAVSQGPPRPPSLSSAGVRASQVVVSSATLGRGSFGAVYRGLFSGCAVAVKVCAVPSSVASTSAAARSAAVQFRRETARFQCLRHPCIVQFFCVVSDGPRLLLVTELMKGGSLFAGLAALRAAGFDRLPRENMLRIAQHVTHGLAYLHATAFSFGDLKTLNVLLSAPPDLENGLLPIGTQAKLCDFGLSRNLNHLVAHDDRRLRPDETQIPARHGPAGTFAYLAPEAFGGLPTDDPDAPKRADVYALGVVLWELATLRKPWPGMRPLQLIGLVAREGSRPEWPHDLAYLPHGFVDLVERCWAQDPLDRPPVDQVARELETMYAALPAGRTERDWSFCKARGSDTEVISDATDETFTAETMGDDGSLSDESDIVHVEEEEEFSTEDLKDKGWSWGEDMQHTATSTVTGESQRSPSNSRTSVHFEEHVPELEITRVISYMLPTGWQLEQERPQEEELEQELLDMSEVSEKSNGRKCELRRDSLKSPPRRRLKEPETPRRYAVPACPDEDVERELAELATMNEDWQKGLVTSSTTANSDEHASVSRGNSEQVKDIVRTYSLPVGLEENNGDIEQMLKMLEAEEVLDINSVGVSMYTRPHFR